MRGLNPVNRVRGNHRSAGANIEEAYAGVNMKNRCQLSAISRQQRGKITNLPSFHKIVREGGEGV
jgi:hypothetical protein